MYNYGEIMNIEIDDNQVKEIVKLWLMEQYCVIMLLYGTDNPLLEHLVAVLNHTCEKLSNE